MSQREKKRVVLIGQDDHGKTTLTSAVKDVLGGQTNITLVDVEMFSATLEKKDIEVAKGALLVVSAPDGPMPKTSEHLSLVKEAGKEVICVFLSEVDMVDDEDLLELTELEVRELLNSYKFAGDEIPIVRGSAREALLVLKKKLGG